MNIWISVTTEIAVQAIHARFFSVFPSWADFLQVLVCPWMDFFFYWAGIIHSAVTDRFVGRNPASQKFLFSVEISQGNPQAGLGWVAHWVLPEPCSWNFTIFFSNFTYFHLGHLQKGIPKNCFSHSIPCCSDQSKCFRLAPGRVARPGGKWMFQDDDIILGMIYRMVLTVVLF